MANPVMDDLGITTSPQAENPLFADLGIEKNPETSEAAREPTSFLGAEKGLLDAGLAVGSGILSGTAGAVLRTANRVIPEFGDTTGAKEELKNKIDELQNRFTYEPQTPEGKYVLHGLGKVVSPIAEGLSKATGAVVGKENVPAVSDVVGAIPGIDLAAAGPSALARGAARGFSGESTAESLKAAQEAGFKTSVGAATGNPIIRSYEAVASKLPGGGPLAEARDINSQAEASVSNIIKKIHPTYDENPSTPREAGQEIEEGAKKSIAKGKNQTQMASDAMHDAVGGKEIPVSSPRLEALIPELTGSTGIPAVDNFVTQAKTKAAAKVVKSVTEESKIPTSYETDGEGYHKISSPNGETHINEMGTGALRVVRDDTHPDFQGKGEGAARLETAAHAATAKGVPLESDISVSPNEAKAFEGLARRGWTVEKNPKAEINPDTGNTISDSPKNPVYTVRAPKTTPIKQATITKLPLQATPEDIEQTAKAQFAKNNHDTVTLKDGRKIYLVHTEQFNGTRDIHAFNEQGNKIGHLDYQTDLTNKGQRWSPNVSVDVPYRRQGLASSMYDSAEKRGGLIPELDQPNAVRTPEGQAFREGRSAKQTEAAIIPPERKFTGEWTYNPKTGKSEPITLEKAKPKQQEGQTAELGEKTPWTFDSLRQFRTAVGRNVKRDATGQSARLYGAISEDLKDFVKSKGPDAEQKYEFFNSTAKLNIAQKTALEKAIKNEGGPGEIFTKAMRGSADDAGRISRVMGAMDEDGRNTFRAVVLHKMGRVSGAQNAPFSADTFLRNWDKMSPEAKNVMFGDGQSATLRKSLDSLRDGLTDMKAGGQLKSNLGNTISQSTHGLSKGAGILGALVFLKEFGQPMARIAEGHPLGAATAVTAGVGALAINPVMSRVLTNPKVVSWLAQSTKVPKATIPLMMTQLQRMGEKDQDAKDLHDLIQQVGEPKGNKDTGVVPHEGTIYPQINRSAGMQPLPGGGYGIPPETL